jgi:SAM-dependent methyltransferase
VYLENPPSYDSLATSFDWAATYERETKRRWKERRLARQWDRAVRVVRNDWLKRDKRLRWVQACTPVGGRILDVGCGDSDLPLRVTQPRRVDGIEISPTLAARSLPRFASTGGEIIESDALSGLQQRPAATYDCILMSSYLEHEVALMEVLKECRRTLKPGGRLIIKVPNYGCWNRKLRKAKWCGFRYPDHVNYFTPQSLTQALIQAGLAIERFSLLDRMPTSDNMWIRAVNPGD